MDWIILSMLVPGIVAILLLLVGFTGCTYDPPRSMGLTAPTNLAVADVGVTTVTLTWINPGELSLAFEIERLREGDADPVLIPVSPFADATVEAVDTGLDAGTSYFYQVRAVRLEDDVESALSNSIFVTTLS
jgi:hypothetical protein